MAHRFRLFVIGALLLIPLLSPAVAANDFPVRPIRLVVGFAPGGATDVVARLVTGALSQELGQTVYVENIGGAAGYIAWKTVAAAPADGYTLMMAENAIGIRPALNDLAEPFDPAAQFDGVAFLAHSPLALAIAKNVPANTVQELVQLSHSTPTKLNYASAGAGSVAQMVWEVVRLGAGIEAVDVPYRGGGPAIAAIVSGHVDMIMASTQVAKPLIEQKMIKALAVTSKERSPALPDIPTLAQAGVRHADVELQFWFGVFVPKGTPADAREKLEKALETVMKNAEVRSKLQALDITPEFAPATALETKLQDEIRNWKAFVASHQAVAR